MRRPIEGGKIDTVIPERPLSFQRGDPVDERVIPTPRRTYTELARFVSRGQCQSAFVGGQGDSRLGDIRRGGARIRHGTRTRVIGPSGRAGWTTGGQRAGRGAKRWKSVVEKSWITTYLEASRGVALWRISVARAF